MTQVFTVKMLLLEGRDQEERKRTAAHPVGLRALHRHDGSEAASFQLNTCKIPQKHAGRLQTTQQTSCR